jgi:polyhydroxybutyrate depolymerase
MATGKATMALLLLAAALGGGCVGAKHVTQTGAAFAARPYDSSIPSKIDPARKYPLLVVLHGLGGSGWRIRRGYQFDRLVESEGFLAVYPDGTRERRWIGRRFWNATDLCCDYRGSGVDDVAYLDAVIADMSAKYPVDPRRVFVVGMSNGAFMAYRYACDRASRVAAIVAQAGAMWADLDRCKPSEPVAVLDIHGDADAVVPYDGRTHMNGGPKEKSAHDSVADWVQFDRCQATADSSGTPLDLISDEDPAVGAETTIEKWSGCRGVELWTMHGGPHNPDRNQPIWATTLYQWLMAHPKPATE